MGLVSFVLGVACTHLLLMRVYTCWRALPEFVFSLQVNPLFFCFRFCCDKPTKPVYVILKKLKELNNELNQATCIHSSAIPCKTNVENSLEKFIFCVCHTSTEEGIYRIIQHKTKVTSTNTSIGKKLIISSEWNEHETKYKKAGECVLSAGNIGRKQDATPCFRLTLHKFSNTFVSCWKADENVTSILSGR